MKRIERTYDHGRGPFTFKGFALGSLAYGTTDMDRSQQIIHLPTGKAVKKNISSVALARHLVLGLQDVLPWDEGEEIVTQANFEKLHKAFQALGV